MALSQAQLTDVCMYGMGSDECKYLDGEHDPVTGDMKFICKKKSLERKAIDEEVQEHMDDCKKQGMNPRSQGVPMGDNCQGFLPMKDLLQGYDV